MSRQQLDDLLAQIRAEREQTLADLVNVREDEFALSTGMNRWDDVRRVLLRFGDHMREHANQAAGACDAIGAGQTMPQRMLAEGEVAWGKLLAATVGLDDEQLDIQPPDSGWSVRQVLEHILTFERNYREAVKAARKS